MLVVCVLLPSSALPAGKGNGSSNNNNGKGNGNSANAVSIARSPQIVGEKDLTASTPGNGKAKGRPAQPERPNARPISNGAKDLVTRFKSARDGYLKQQKALALQYKNATKEEREAIRDKLKDLLESYKEQQKSFREELRDRARSIRKELDPSLGRVIEKSKSGSRGR